MSGKKLFFRIIPLWAYLLVLLVLSAAALYSYNRILTPVSGESGRQVENYYIIDYIVPGGNGDQAGLTAGDTLMHVNSFSIPEWFSRYHGQTARDTLFFGVMRNGSEKIYPVIGASKFMNSPGYFWFINILITICSIGGLYILFKRPGDKASQLFFIYIQFFMVLMNGEILGLPLLTFHVAAFIFITLSCQLGPTIIHFHLYFPRPVRILDRYKHLPWVFHLTAVLISVVYLIAYFHDNSGLYPQDRFYYLTERIALAWLTFCFCIAVGIVFYQFAANKDTLLRNQLRLVIIGSLFGVLTPILLTFFYNQIVPLQYKFPSLLPLMQGGGGMLMVIFILIALFRYRIWNIEIIFRKVLLYLAATIIIVLCYLGLVWLTDQYVRSENQLIRYAALGISVLVFLVLRDRLQLMIDRVFNREPYDSASVVSEFEGKLAGVYQSEVLKQKIVEGINEIFHFKTFVFSLKESGRIYEPIVLDDGRGQSDHQTYEINYELEEKLKKSRVLSPYELKNVPAIPGMEHVELIVPATANGQPAGFFLCGQKKSERIYSQQDIRVLSLLARRVIALLHTATLYQRDLDRQLMLERERARISQDMHDDIGAGLTRIAMISEAPLKTSEPSGEIANRLLKVAMASREMISRLNVIVWALNPRYDNLESLISYLRRYFGEYVENFGIRLLTEVPDNIPEVQIAPDSRRNIFYAVQEAVHNAVKHGECTEISLDISIDPELLKMNISDNGKGFDAKRNSAMGNGLHNMRKRAEEMGGNCRIETGQGTGTTVLLSFKYQTKV